MKPSLHELISKTIYLYSPRGIDIALEEADELAEQIIKIVRDYHLVESNESWYLAENKLSREENK